MDLNQAVWDALREKGHRIGARYVAATGGMIVDVDDVAMSILDARAIAVGRITITQVAATRAGADLKESEKASKQ